MFKLAESENEAAVEQKVFEIVPRAAREQAIKERESSMRAAAAEAQMSAETAAAEGSGASTPMLAQ